MTISPSLAARATPRARRQQILNAACDQVRRSGFHGASMAQIAKSAALSVGQIYRYFANKEAIIAAIVDQDLAEMREKFAELESRSGRLVDALVGQVDDAVDRCYDPRRASLMLEVVAEASRNPKVAAIVRAADDQERALANDLMAQGDGSAASEVKLAARTEVIMALFDGLVMRGVNHPDADRPEIVQVVKDLLDHLLARTPG
jgi:AcrR family transcriptional regulator